MVPVKIESDDSNSGGEIWGWRRLTTMAGGGSDEGEKREVWRRDNFNLDRWKFGII